MKKQGLDQVLAAIRTVLGGQLYFSPQVSALALRRLGKNRCEGNSKIGLIGNLSDRELQVLELLGAGMGSRKIAEELGLSVKTIEAHREHIKHKLCLKSASQLTTYSTNWLKSQSWRHAATMPTHPAETTLPV
jgi:DNA-binding NarL/FixJ family response regulator